MSQQTFSLIGLGLGTTMLKAVMIDLTGMVVSSHKIKMLYQSQGARVEFDATDYYQTIASLIRQLIAATLAGMQVFGISIASASGNTVLPDQVRMPLRPAISWLDERASAEPDDLENEVSDDWIISRNVALLQTHLTFERMLFV